MQKDWFDAFAHTAIADLLFPSAEKQPRQASRPASQRSLTSHTSDEGGLCLQVSPTVSRLRCQTAEEFVEHKAPLIVNEMKARTGITSAETYAATLPLRSAEDLKGEKSRVKRELSAYDREFRRDIGRLPLEREKTPMRLFYLCYKRLKQAIEQREKQPLQDEVERARVEVTAQLATLQARKKRLNQTLFAFQKNFETSFSRPIRHSSDLEPVKREYAEYQEVKKEIAVLKDWLSRNS